MNYSLLKYRLKVGGLSWAFRTGMGLVSEKLSRPQQQSSPAQMGSTGRNSAKILYIHSGWAIESVGKLWFSDQEHFHVTFQKTGSALLTPEYLEKFDLVWYGYSSLYSQHPVSPERTIIAVHDPVELFPERSDWKENPVLKPEHRERLANARAVVVISREMQEILQRNGISAGRLPTRSTLPLRETATISAGHDFGFLSVGRIYRRKNFEQFRRIAKVLSKRGIPSYLKCDHFASGLTTYLQLLDRYPVYVCTSFQEGGPLPLMDAMHRGAVPVSAPVGQALEIIRHGENGFICRTDDEFIDIVARLAAEPARLAELRRNSLASIASSRSQNVVSGAVEDFLTSLLQTHPNT